MNGVAGITITAVAASAGLEQQAQIGPSFVVFLVAIVIVAWSVQTLKAAMPEEGEEAGGDAEGVDDHAAVDSGVCTSCGKMIAVEKDRCDNCSVVGHWRK